MSTCARCGHEECYSGTHDDAPDEEKLGCRDRQIAAQAALLRSVTGKLEEAAELLQDIANPAAAISARNLIDSVLEVLS